MLKEADGRSLYSGAVLAPMVRCGTLPLRVLALRMGANAVWGEEIIDKKLALCQRVVNEELSTVDFVSPDGSIVFRTCPSIEKGRLVCQLGTADGESALAAARVVENDVDGIDVNMGCPIKFSTQGGMGAALLADSERAVSIVRTLAMSCKVPVSAKIRMLKTMEETIAFARGLVEAGASCITLHMRHPFEKDRDPAHWDVMPTFAEALKPTPVLANGDMYRWADIDALMRNSGCAGAMLARPALLNTSMFRRTLDPKTGALVGAPLMTLEEVLNEYIEESIRWDLNYQNCKYTIMEMLNNRRHQKRFCSQKADLGPARSMQEVGKAKSLRDLAAVFGFDDAAYASVVARRASESPETWAARHDVNYDTAGASRKNHVVRAADGDNEAGLDKREDISIEEPSQKRAKGLLNPVSN